MTRQENTVNGCYYDTAKPAREFPLYADMYLRGRLDLERLVTKTFRLDEINEAYAEMLAGNVARGVVTY